MKKVLIATFVLSVSMATSVMATETYTGALLNSVQKKIDSTTAPVVNTEKQLRQKQADLQTVGQKQNPLDAQKKAQQDLVNRKKQQVQTQKDLFNQQKQDIKGLFSVQ